MSLQTFFDNFALLADAPNGIAKLRELILRLAVRGKLVPQNPNDEPATSLVESIFQEKSRLAKNKVVRKTEPSKPIQQNEIPYLLPDRWVWQRVEDVFYSISPSQNKIKSSEVKEAGKFPVIDQGKKYIAGFLDDESKLIRIPGSVIIFGDHTCELKFVDFDFIAGADGVKILRPIKVYEPYFFRVVQTFEIAERGYSRHYKFFLDNLFPLPPLEEQKRIVTKVDELMRLCDELEVRQQAKRVSRVRLNNATLVPLNNAASIPPEEFEQAVVRLADNFISLFDSAKTVDKLRSTIHQLAIQGKLAQQDPHDEPASALIKKIKKELIDESKKADQGHPIKSCELKFQLPRGWSAARIGELFFISSGTTPSRVKREYFIGGTENWVKTTDLNNGIVTTCEEKITLQAVKDCNLKNYPVGTVCVAMYGGSGTIGKSGILGFETTINQSVCGITPSKYYLPEFLHLYIKSIRSEWMSFAAGLRKDPNINAKIIRSMILLIPPLEEQKRIVAKVNQLMALCDELETKLRQTEADSEKLMKSAVLDLLASITNERSSIGQEKSRRETALALSST